MTNLYDNDFVKEGDLVKLRYKTKNAYIAQVIANSYCLTDFVIFFGKEKLWIYDDMYESQNEGQVKSVRDGIEAIYRENDIGDYVCVWRKSSLEGKHEACTNN